MKIDINKINREKHALKNIYIKEDIYKKRHTQKNRNKR